MLVIRLVEEDILAVSTLFLGRILFEGAVLSDAVLTAEMLPEVRSNLVTVERWNRNMEGQLCSCVGHATFVWRDCLALYLPALAGL